jgi:transcriptional regulator
MGMHKVIKQSCEECNISFEVRLAYAKRGKGRFCSTKCAVNGQYGAPQTRFWSHVQKTNGCWIWTGVVNAAGYGQLKIAGKTVRAHRFSYELTVAKIPDGLFVCHNCDNTRCVRPGHLFLGDQQANMMDMRLKGRWRGPKIESISGENNANSKLSNRQVENIRTEYHKGIRQVDLAKRYGISQASISYIVNKKYQA